MKKQNKPKQAICRLAQKIGFSLLAILWISSIVYWNLSFALPSSTRPLVLYGNSKKDHLELFLLHAIGRATRSIWISSYGISDQKVLSLLQKKADSGVEVDLVYHETINENLRKIETSHLRCHPQKAKGIMHEKVVIIDDLLTFIGSTNLTTSSLTMHDNSLVGIYSKHLARAVKNRHPSPYREQINDQMLSLFFLPSSGKKALAHLLHTLDQAKKEVTVALFTFTHPLLAEKLLSLSNQGVKITLFIDRFAAKGSSKKVVEKLLKGKITIFASQGIPLFHHKWAMIDQKTLVLGSANWTKAAFEKNRELLFFCDPLKQEQKAHLHSMISTFIRESILLDGNNKLPSKKFPSRKKEEMQKNLS